MFWRAAVFAACLGWASLACCGCGCVRKVEEVAHFIEEVPEFIRWAETTKFIIWIEKRVPEVITAAKAAIQGVREFASGERATQSRLRQLLKGCPENFAGCVTTARSFVRENPPIDLKDFGGCKHSAKPGYDPSTAVEHLPGRDVLQFTDGFARGWKSPEPYLSRVNPSFAKEWKDSETIFLVGNSRDRSEIEQLRMFLEEKRGLKTFFFEDCNPRCSPELIGAVARRATLQLVFNTARAKASHFVGPEAATIAKLDRRGRQLALAVLGVGLAAGAGVIVVALGPPHRDR